MLSLMVLLLNSCKRIHEPDETDITGVWHTTKIPVHIISIDPSGFGSNWPEKAQFRIEFIKNYTFEIKPYFYPEPFSKDIYKSSYASTSGKWKYNRSQNSITMEITETGDVSRISSVILLSNSDGYLYGLSCEVRSETLNATNSMRFMK